MELPMPDFDPHAPLDAAARAALRDLRGEHKRYQQEKLKMTLADPLDDAPDPAWGPYFRGKPLHGGAYREAILDEATQAVTGAREDTYGGPEASFTVIAQFWSAYLDRQVAPHDIAAMLALLKLARIKHSRGGHRDSWVDLAGYAACGAECALGDASA